MPATSDAPDGSAASMSADADRLPPIACLKADAFRASLVSTTGFHCEVWRVSGTLVREGERQALDLVVKHHLEPASWGDSLVLRKEYDMLREALGDIVPSAVFVRSRVGPDANVTVLARAVKPWFNLANPVNETEAIPLLRRLRRARENLGHFIHAAHRWREEQGLVIDLYGLDNLVLDVDRRIRYVDSFRVFFYEDLLHVLHVPDPDLSERISLSRRRLDYLRHLHRQATIRCIV